MEKMILTEFDYEKNAIINPWHTSDMVQGMPKVAVTCFSRVTFARMLSVFGERELQAQMWRIWRFQFIRQYIMDTRSVCLCQMLEHQLVLEQWKKSMQWV